MSARESSAPSSLPRQLGLWSATAIVMGNMIGSGIFRVPATVADNVGTPTAMMLAWVAGGAVAVCGALALAEVAALYPRAGGTYVYIYEAYGPFLAFLFGWALLLVAPLGIASLALVHAEYFGRLVPLTPTGTRMLAAFAVILVTTWNYRSIRYGAVVQNLSTSAKVLAILVLAAAAFLLGEGEVSSSPDTPPTWTGFGLAIIAVLWAYNGWQELTYVGGEVRDPGRTLPRALIYGTVGVMAVYLAANAAYLRVLPMDVIAGSPLVAADVAVRLVGPIGTALIAGLVCVSTFGTLNGITMVQPRVFYAMANDGLFFRRIGSVHPRFQTPHAAIVLISGLALCFLALSTFERLIEAFILGTLPFWGVAVASVITLRRKRPDLARPYRTPGYPVVPVLFVLSTVALVGNSLLERPGSTALSLGAILVGIPIYFAWARHRTRV
jgi:APA family basic amino acid/polyamine antiporter